VSLLPIMLPDMRPGQPAAQISTSAALTVDDPVDPWAAVRYLLVNPNRASQLLEVSRATMYQWWEHLTLCSLPPFTALRSRQRTSLAIALSVATFGYVPFYHVLRQEGARHVTHVTPVPHPRPIHRIHPEHRRAYAPIIKALVQHIHRIRQPNNASRFVVAAQQFGFRSPEALRAVLRCEALPTVDQAQRMCLVARLDRHALLAMTATRLTTHVSPTRADIRQALDIAYGRVPYPFT